MLFGTDCPLQTVRLALRYVLFQGFCTNLSMLSDSLLSRVAAAVLDGLCLAAPAAGGRHMLRAPCSDPRPRFSCSSCKRDTGYKHSSDWLLRNFCRSVKCFADCPTFRTTPKCLQTSPCLNSVTKASQTEETNDRPSGGKKFAERSRVPQLQLLRTEHTGLVGQFKDLAIFFTGSFGTLPRTLVQTVGQKV